MTSGPCRDRTASCSSAARSERRRLTIGSRCSQWWPLGPHDSAAHRALSEPAGLVDTGGYADDLHVQSESVVEALRAHRLTLVWVCALGLALNVLKCEAMGGHELMCGDQRVPDVGSLRLLGYRLQANGFVGEAPDKRVARALRRLHRPVKMPGTKLNRERLVAAVALPVLYGSETVEYTAKQLGQLRRAACHAVRGAPPSNVEAIEVWATCAVRGHLADPVQFIAYSIVRNWVRWLSQPPSARREDLITDAYAEEQAREPLPRRGGGGRTCP